MIVPTIEPPGVPNTGPSPILRAAHSTKSGKPSNASTIFTPPTPAQLYKEFPQDIELCYKAAATGATVLFVMIKQGWFEDGAFEGVALARIVLSDMHPDYESMIVTVPKLMNVDFSSLRIPRYDYASQTEIDKRRVWLLAACAVHYNLDFGLVVRFLPEDVLARHRDKAAILDAA